MTRIGTIQSSTGALLTPPAGSPNEANTARPATTMIAPVTIRAVIRWPVRK